MFFALLWLYNEYNEHVQNLDPSTKCTSIWALACLDMPRLDTERPDIEILQNVEFKILCSHATYQECMSSLWCLHVESSREEASSVGLKPKPANFRPAA